jgi:hypothetical protein
MTRFAVVCCLILTFGVSPFQTNSAEKLGKCRVPSVKEAHQYSKAVFVGEVTKVAENGDVKTFTFKAEKYWKGAANREIKINVQETARYQAWFEVGEKYLVYARGSEENEKLWETRCSRSKLLADASEDIKVLGKARETVKK